MRRAIVRVVMLVILVAGTTVSREYLVQRRELRSGPGRNDPPNSFFGVFVFGGFRPLFLEYLWSKADRLYSEGRYWEVIDVFGRITRLDPDNPRIRWHTGQTMAFDIAQAEIDDAMRYRYYRQTVGYLRRGIERSPDAWTLRELLHYICLNRIDPDPYVSRQFERNTGFDGLGWALEVGGEFYRSFPDHPIAATCYVRAAELAGERLVRRNRFGDAARAFTELTRLLVEILDRQGTEVVSAREVAAAREWSSILDSLAASVRPEADGLRLLDRARLEAVLQTLEESLTRYGPFRFDPQVALPDATILALIHVRVMQLGQSACLAEKPADALWLIPRLRRIAGLAEGRIGPQLPYYSVAYVDSFGSFLELDQARLEAAGESTETERPLWKQRLEELDRLVTEQTGVSDNFARRLLESRR